MERLDYSILFATKAHDLQRRKTDNVLMIFHPFTVGMMLKDSNMSEDCVIAGILHDVVEDTKYILNDIKKEFGDNVAKIVEEVTEDKSLPWEERKRQAIDKIKTASFEGKMVECADKINNLETLYDLILEKGDEVWKSFNRPYEKQKWYYTEMYNAVIVNSKDNKLYERYKVILDKLFK